MCPIAIEFAQPQSGPGAEQAAFGYGALQTTLATQPNQKDMFGAQVQANRDQLQANLGVNKDVFGAAVNSAMADKAAMYQAQRDQFQAEQQAQRQDQQFQQQSQLADQHANLQQQLSEAQLSQGETLRMQRLQEAMDYVDNDPSLGPVGEDTEDRSAAKLQIRTGLNPLQMRQQRAQAVASELQLQQVQKQQANADAMRIGGMSAENAAWLSTNGIDQGDGSYLIRGHNGDPVGTYDTNTGTYTDFAGQARRDQQAAQQQARDDAAEEKARMAEEKRQQKIEDDARKEEINRQNQLAAATQRADAAIRGELMDYRRASALNPGAAAPPWLQAEIDARTPPNGTAPAVSSLSADELNSLMADEVESRVRNTHGHLIGIDPSGWQRAAGSEGNPFTGEQSTGATAAAPSNPVQVAVANVASSVMQQQSTPPSASRVDELLQKVTEDLGRQSFMSRNMPTFGLANTEGSVLGQMRDLLAGATGRSLTTAENARYRSLLTRLRRSHSAGNGPMTGPVDPSRFPDLVP